ncbi:MAG: hypothetical protein OXM61_03255 [Candidatus Poribacteria bacterium]|nr:hypothetical protein [Candidatus Poribacteria bacterium]
MYNPSYSLEIHDLCEFLTVEVLVNAPTVNLTTADAKALPELWSDRLASIITRTDLDVYVYIEASSLYRNSKNGHIPAYFCSLSQTINLLSYDRGGTR